MLVVSCVISWLVVAVLFARAAALVVRAAAGAGAVDLEAGRVVGVAIGVVGIKKCRLFNEVLCAAVGSAAGRDVDDAFADADDALADEEERAVVDDATLLVDEVADALDDPLEPATKMMMIKVIAMMPAMTAVP